MKVFTSIRVALVLILLAALGQTTRHPAQTRSSPRLPDLTNIINAIRFSPDGRLLAIACGLRDDNRVELWESGTGKLLRTIKGFDGPVWSVSFSPDGRTLVTGSSGIHPEKISEKINRRSGRRFTELKWWDAQTGEFKQRFELPEEELVGVAVQYSPDGKVLAAIEHRAQTMMRFQTPQGFEPASRAIFFPRQSMKYDSNIKLLDAKTGEMIVKLKEGFANYELPLFRGFSPSELAMSTLAGQRRPAMFSPDGRFVAAWNSSEVRLWSVMGEEVLKLKKFKGRLKAVSFSPDGSVLAAAITRSSRRDQSDAQSEIRVWEIPTGVAKQVIPITSQGISSLVFVRNGKQLLIAGLKLEDNHSYASLELADLQSGALGTLIARDEGVLSSIDLSPAGDLLAFQTGASVVKLVDTREWRSRYTVDTTEGASSAGGASLRRFMVSVKTIPAVAFLADGKTVVGAVEGGGIKQWDARTGETRKVFAQDAETGSIAEISKSGAVLADITSDERVRIWNLETGSHSELPSEAGPVETISLSGDGKTLAVAYSDRIVLVKTGDSGNPKMTSTVQGKAARIALSFDGSLLAGITAEGDLKIWKAADGTLQKRLAAGTGISALKFAPQNQALALGGKDGRVSLWRLPEGVMSFDSRKHDEAVNAIAFSDDGALMATGSDDRTVVLWDVAAGKSRRTLKGHDFTVTSLAFSAGGSLLAVATGNASVVLWEVEGGKLNRVLR